MWLDGGQMKDEWKMEDGRRVDEGYMEEDRWRMNDG